MSVRVSLAALCVLRAAAVEIIPSPAGVLGRLTSARIFSGRYGLRFGGKARIIWLRELKVAAGGPTSQWPEANQLRVCRPVSGRAFRGQARPSPATGIWFQTPLFARAS